MALKSKKCHPTLFWSNKMHKTPSVTMNFSISPMTSALVSEWIGTKLLPAMECPSLRGQLHGTKKEPRQGCDLNPINFLEPHESEEP